MVSQRNPVLDTEAFGFSEQDDSIVSASSLVRKVLISPDPKDDYDQDSIFDEVSIDASQIDLKPGEDVMADFGGFLEKRKKDRGMARNTMMSQIDGLVSNLNSDITTMMEQQSTRMHHQKKQQE